MKKLIAIILILVVAGVVYFYIENKKSVVPSSTAEQKFQDVLAKRKAEEVSKPPVGYLVPSTVPAGYEVTENTERFTAYSTYFPYKSTTQKYLQFSETSKDTYDAWLKREVGSTEQVLRVVKEFTYNGSKGAVVGVFVNENSFKQFPNKSTEKTLVYDHDGRLVKIHAIDAGITADKLIELLKKMTVSQ